MDTSEGNEERSKEEEETPRKKKKSKKNKKKNKKSKKNKKPAVPEEPEIQVVADNPEQAGVAVGVSVQGTPMADLPEETVDVTMDAAGATGPPTLQSYTWEYNEKPVVVDEHLRNKGMFISVVTDTIPLRLWIFGVENHGSDVRVDGTSGKVYHGLVEYEGKPGQHSEEHQMNEQNMADSSFMNFLYMAGATVIFPFANRPEFKPSIAAQELRPRTVETSTRAVSIEQKFMVTAHTWKGTPLPQHVSFRDQILGKQEDTTHSTHMRPDIVRWRRLFEKKGQPYTLQQWGFFVNRGPLYAIPPEIDCDRSFATHASSAPCRENIPKNTWFVHPVRRPRGPRNDYGGTRGKLPGYPIR